MKKNGLIKSACILSALLLTSCANYRSDTPHDSQSAGGKYCRELKREINLGYHRYNRKGKVSPNKRAYLMKLYQKGCE